MANGDLYRATYKYNVARQPVLVTLGYEEIATTGSVQDEVCSLIALDVASKFGSQNNLFAADVTLEGCKVRKVTGMPAAPGEAYSLTEQGTYPGQALPAIKSLMVVHKQQTADVRRNGKSYIAGIPEAQTNGNEMLNDALPDALVMLFDDLMEVTQAIPAGTLQARMVVLSRPAMNPSSIVGLPVVTNTCRRILYNSKRRQTRETGYALDTPVP